MDACGDFTTSYQAQSFALTLSFNESYPVFIVLQKKYYVKLLVKIFQIRTELKQDELKFIFSNDFSFQACSHRLIK